MNQLITTTNTRFEEEAQGLRSQITALESELSAVRVDHTNAKEQEQVLLATVDTLNQQLAEQVAAIQSAQSASASNNKNMQESQEEREKEEEERKASLVQALAQVDTLTRQLTDSQQQGEVWVEELAEKDDDMKQLQLQIDSLQSTHQGSNIINPNPNPTVTKLLPNLNHTPS